MENTEINRITEDIAILTPAQKSQKRKHKKKSKKHDNSHEKRELLSATHLQEDVQSQSQKEKSASSSDPSSGGSTFVQNGKIDNKCNVLVGSTSDDDEGGDSTPLKPEVESGWLDTMKRNDVLESALIRADEDYTSSEDENDHHTTTASPTPGLGPGGSGLMATATEFKLSSPGELSTDISVMKSPEDGPVNMAAMLGWRDSLQTTISAAIQTPAQEKDTLRDSFIDLTSTIDSPNISSPWRGDPKPEISLSSGEGSVLSPKSQARSCSICASTNLIVKIDCSEARGGRCKPMCYPCLKGSFGVLKIRCPQCQASLPSSLSERANERDIESDSFLDEYIERCKAENIPYVYMYAGNNGGWWCYQYNTNKTICNSSNNTFSINIMGRSVTMDLREMKQKTQVGSRHIMRTAVANFRSKDVKGIAGVSKTH